MKLSHPSWRIFAGLEGESGLTDDLLQEAAKRLQIVSLILLSLWLFYLVIELWLAHLLQDKEFFAGIFPDKLHAHHLVVMGGGLFLSLGMYLLARSHRLPPQKLLNLGLVYEVLIALLIAVGNTGEAIRTQDLNPYDISFVCIWILIFPTIVPNTPGKTFAAAMTAAVMDPLVMSVYALFIAHKPWHPVILLFFVTSYICAFLAILPSRILMKLRSHLEQARQLGSYQLGDLIGRGGMGEVYRARHRMLARPAAVKIIRADALGAADPEAARAMLQRFEREAKATATLQSPHSIDIFDFGSGSSGTFYYVMELLDGMDLSTFVQRFGPMSPARARAVLLQACHSLYDAHQRGLIHRDIKPANLFICRMGQDHDFVKVLDFGLVKASDGGTSQDTLATRQGVATGTPAFMAPEQILGKGPLDHRLDIYALGCVAYWLLTGELVFTAETNMEMMIQHAREKPLPPSRRSELPVPEALDAIILQCLAKEPSQRPQTARELAQILEACRCPDAWGKSQAREWWDLHLPPGFSYQAGVDPGEAALSDS